MLTMAGCAVWGPDYMGNLCTFLPILLKLLPKYLFLKRKRFHLFQPHIAVMNMPFLCSHVKFRPLENPSGEGGLVRTFRIQTGLGAQEQFPSVCPQHAAAASLPALALWKVKVVRECPACLQ